MNGLHIDIGGAAHFAPGDVVNGEANWRLDAEPSTLEVRLVWRTSGRGGTDLGVVDAVVIDRPGRTGAKRFTFTMPDGPLSFSGRLITLEWVVELIGDDPAATERKPIELIVGAGPIDIARTRKLTAEDAV